MATNLATKYHDQLIMAFTKESLVKGLLDNEVSFLGAKTVRLTFPQTVAMNSYKRTGTNRYGTPMEMQDTIQDLTMTQDRSFSLTIDKGNYNDQMLMKKAGAMLKLQISERAVPEYDLYVFTKLAQKAGTVVGGEPLTKENIVDRISTATEFLDDKEIPQDSRMLFVNSGTYKLLRHSPEFLAVDKLAEASLTKGMVGEYDNMKVIKVPKSRFPAGLNFIVVHKKSATAPIKISETHLHQDPPGLSGHLLEGREYYDCFIYAPRAYGVYADVDNTVATVCEAPAIASNGALTSETTGVKFYYTIDGSDPRYSSTAMQGASAYASSGTTVKAYCTKTDAYDSPVAEHKF